MPSDFETALNAVDRLNSWVRSESFRRQHIGSFSLRRMIYYLKRQAIERSQSELNCQHTPFIVQTRCRDCGGDGRYTDYNGYKHDHCWGCRNTGTATLNFIESKIGDLFVWHSPLDKFSLPSSVLLSSGDPGKNWTVNQPGRDLTPDQAAECLNSAHEVFRQPAPKHYSSSVYDSWETDDNLYSLWIGDDNAICVHCDATEDLVRCGKRTCRVEFSFFVCKDCTHRLTADQQWNVTIPVHLFKLPNVNAWICRQNALAERKAVVQC